MEHDITRLYYLYIAAAHKHVALSHFYDESEQRIDCLICLHLDRLVCPFTGVPKCGWGLACCPGCVENADAATDFPLLLKSRSSPYTTSSLKGGSAYQAFAYHYVTVFSLFAA